MVLGLVWGHPLHMFLLCSRMALLTRTRALLWTFLLLHLDVIHIHVNTQPQGIPSNSDKADHINLKRMVLLGDREDMQCMLSNTLCKQDNMTSKYCLFLTQEVHPFEPLILPIDHPFLFQTIFKHHQEIAPVCE